MSQMKRKLEDEIEPQELERQAIDDASERDLELDDTGPRYFDEYGDPVAGEDLLGV